MKTTRAWGWITAGVLALGFNGIYQDGGGEWTRRMVGPIAESVADRAGPILALVSGRADLFVTKAGLASTREKTVFCSARRVRRKVSRPGFQQAQKVLVLKGREVAEERQSQLEALPEQAQERFDFASSSAQVRVDAMP